MTAQPPATKIQRGARRIRRIAYAAAILAMLCVGSELLLALAPLWKGGDTVQVPADVLAQLMIAGPVVFFVLGLQRARRLFRRIEAGESFSDDNSRDFARIGWAVIGGAVWSLTIGEMAPTQSSALALELASIGEGARDLALLALGLALLVIGQLMAQAGRLKAENDSFL
jgi:hypothetical protein